MRRVPFGAGYPQGYTVAPGIRRLVRHCTKRVDCLSLLIVWRY